MPTAEDIEDTDGASYHQPVVEAVLAAATDSAVSLLAQSSRPPSLLRVQAGDVVVEAQWAAEIQATSGNGSVAPSVPSATVAPTPAGDASPESWRADRHLVCSPTVGCFYRAPEPGATPFVDVGDQVVAGQQVGIVEVMKLMMPVKAEMDGTIVELLKDDGANVEHGEPLFAVAPV
jgi:acetyl-CoA carboxylase biotin carboxyl carrier protein